MNEDRLKKALQQIGCMNFNTGRADLLGLRIKEIVRKAFNPTTCCPRCNGKGQIPSPSRDCGICRSYNPISIGSGICKKEKEEGLIDECNSVCSEFDDVCPWETCPSCGGENSCGEEY